MNPSTTSTLGASRFTCLQARLLHEQCGHIESLRIHELPCARTDFGWLPESTLLNPSETADCNNISQHLAIKKDKCAKCKMPGLEPEPKKTLWELGTSKATRVEKKREKGDVLPINIIVARRKEWLGMIGMQKEKRGKRVEGD